jgi:hypothetical protein
METLSLNFGSKADNPNEPLSLHRSSGNLRLSTINNAEESRPRTEISNGELWVIFQPIDKLLDIVEDTFQERFGQSKGHKVYFYMRMKFLIICFSHIFCTI